MVWEGGKEEIEREKEGGHAPAEPTFGLAGLVACARGGLACVLSTLR